MQAQEIFWYNNNLNINNKYDSAHRFARYGVF